MQIDERPPTLRRGPAHGEHTEHILEELAYDWEEITRLKDAGVVL